MEQDSSANRMPGFVFAAKAREAIVYGRDFLMKKIQKSGKIVFSIGLVTLLAGLIVNFTLGTIVAQILLLSSIFINAAGITMLRWKG